MLKNQSFNGVGFYPWIGERYDGDNRFGVRVLVLGESHYGEKGTEVPTYTRGVVCWHTQRARTGEGITSQFFTKVATVLCEKPEGINDGDLAKVFQEIAFYNFLQTFKGGTARGKATSQEWEDSQAPLKTVLDGLRPDAVLVLGRELSRRIPDFPEDTPRADIAHPAWPDFSYNEAIPKFQNLLEQAKARVG